ncbi:MAG: hypothetical protein ABSD42_04450 [Candidatus Bathyarchaeia archaeon]
MEIEIADLTDEDVEFINSKPEGSSRTAALVFCIVKKQNPTITFEHVLNHLREWGHS